MANLPQDVQAALLKSCVKARKSRKPHRFFYCPAGEDDAPVLLIGRRLSPGDIRDIRRGARQKKYLTGEVLSEEGTLVLVPAEAGPSARLKKHLRSWYGPAVPLLRRAIVRDGEEEDGAGGEGGWGGDVDEAAARLASIRAEVAEAEAAEAAAQQQVEGLIAEVAAAKAGWEALGISAEAAEGWHRDRAKETSTVLGRVRGFFSGRRTASARDEAERSALWAAEDARDAALKGQRVYERLLTELSEAQVALVAGQETLDRLEAEAALARAEAERVRLALEAARGEGTERTRELYAAESALESALGADPLLAEVLEEAQRKESEADDMAEESIAIQLELEVLEAERAELLSELVVEPDSAQLGRLDEVEAALQERGAWLSVLIDAIDEADEDAGAARRTLDAAAAASDSPAVVRALAKQRRARRYLGQAEAAEITLEQGLDRAAEAVEEAARLRKVEEVAIQARSAVAGYADFYADVLQIDPRSPEHIARHAEPLSRPTTINALADASHFYEQLVAAGATVDEIKAIFALVPPAWRPAALAEHLLWFEKLDAWEQQMTEHEADEALLQEIEAELAGSVRLTALDADAELLRNNIERELKLLNSAHGGGLIDSLPAGAVGTMIQITQLVNAGMDARNLASALHGHDPDATVFDRETGEQVAVDPVTQKMRDEQLMGLLAGLGPLGLNVLGAVTDAVGQSLTGPTQIVKAEGLYRQVKEAAARVGTALSDAKLLEEAAEDSHVAAEALQQSRDQERRAAARAAIGASLKALDLGADFAVIAGQGLTAAAVCKIAVVSGDLTSRAVSSANDFRIASKARKLFEQARDTSRSAEARAEAARRLFKFSQKHAKGILAWLAKEGDPVAMKYARSRGLSDSDIQRTTPAVLQRFLLKRAGEGTGEQETFDEWLDGVVAAWEARLDRIGQLLRSTGQQLEAWLDALSHGRTDARLSVRTVPPAAVEALSAALEKLSDRRRFLVSRPRSERVTGCLKRLDTTRSRFDQDAAEKRVLVSDNLRTLSGYRDEIRQHIVAADVQTVPVWRGAESRVETLTRTNLQSMQLLANLR